MGRPGIGGQGGWGRCCAHGAAGAVFLLATGLPALAQEDPRPAPPLAIKQDMIRDRLERFRDRVFRLQQDLIEQEPENAERLARALRRLGENGAPEKVAELVARLSGGENLRETLGLQEQTVADLEVVLDVLMQRDSRNEERQAQIDQLAEQLERLSQLLDRQLELRDRTSGEAQARQLAEQLERARQQVEHLLQQQQQLSRQRADAGNGQSSALPREAQAGKQQELSLSAEALAEQLRQAAQPMQADASGGQLEQPQPPQPAAAAQARTQEAGQALQSAANRMSEAAEAIRQAQDDPASQKQDEAEQDLRRTLHALQEAQQALAQNADAARDQRSLAEDTQQLAQDLNPAQPSQGGSPDAPQRSSSSAPSPASAAEPMQQAEREMWDAAEKLEHRQEPQAVEKQDKAIDALREAKRELEDALQQKRKEEREEILRDLEARFHDMFVRQKRINEETHQLDSVGATQFGRAEQLRAAELGATQARLGDTADTCLHILEEEGTTLVFPRILEQVATDMRLVAERLSALQTGALTQSMQQEILDALQQLLEAVRRMQQENQEQQDPQPSSPSDMNAPLLPTSAELKLLRAAQARVHERTLTLDQARAAESEAVDVLGKTLEATALRQSQCAELARQMRERMEQP